ncbi:MAG TPA: putative nucleotidyltransferase substrate binding domain-containing protein [Solirubrobacteraceae bacterium]|nr:putative nucleotidyltransferase substrate binding domain-containing protein [Solirubrobacteraceae bacterium]
MVHDVADFLGAHAPFDALDDDELDAVASAAEVEFHARGTVILHQGSAPGGHVWVLRTGTVELLDGGRALDLLGEGEMIGHPSMLSGLPATFEVQAAEDVLLYRLPADVAASVLARPSGVRFLARTLQERPIPEPGVAEPSEIAAGAAADPALRPVGLLIRSAPVVCRPDTAIRDAARRMGETGTTAVVVTSREGGVGIVTDRDLRSRVATGEVPVDAPVSAVMTSGAFTVTPEQLGGDVLLELLDRGVRHAPVVDGAGRVLGVLDDLDLLATEARLPFRLRRAVAEAPTADRVAEAARQLPDAVVALFDAGLAATRIAAVSATVVDALTRRLVELAAAGLGPAPAPVSWLALGSQGRREAILSSDSDTGLVWHGDDADPHARRWAADLGARVIDGLDACGLRVDEHGVRADTPLFARSADAWRSALESWMTDPGQEQAVIASSVLFDGRTVAGPGVGETVLAALAPPRRDERLVRLLARMALAHRPPSGFRRDVVLAHDGEHRGTFDVKRGGVLPIVDLARWAGVCAGCTATGTAARLEAGAAAAVLSDATARTLAEAWDLLSTLRLEHQVEQHRAGLEPDDHLDPATLNPLARRYLREAFRAVIAVQRRVDRELATEQAFGTGR